MRYTGYKGRHLMLNFSSARKGFGIQTMLVGNVLIPDFGQADPL